MRSRTARFFHDHVLVKRPGTSTVTPWHQDQPYYCVEATQSVSFWTPLDPVARSVALECVAGSHRWSEAGFRPRRFDGTPLYASDAFEEAPDIDAERERLTILGWDMAPGDAVAFNFRTIHGAPANASDSGSAARLDRTIALARQSTPQVLSAEQSNSSIVYGRQGIFKLYRRIESGVQPDLEVVTYLTGRHFAHTPELIGAVEYVDAHSGRAAIGMLQCFASNQGTGWEQFLAHLGAQFGRAPTRKVASPQSAEWPAAAALGDLASLLGRRTAELHLALAGREPSATDLPETLSGGVGAVDPAFGAELIAPAWLRQLGQTVRQTVERSLGLLSGHIGMLELRWRATAEQVLRHSQRLLDRSEMHDDRPLSGWISRCHGDYHLGQVLWTGTDYMIIDFEGEPARVLAERRAKHSPLKDVAGMLRSFDYAGYCAAETVRGEQPGASLEGVRSELVDGLSRAFLHAYEQVMEPAGLLPEAGRQRQTLIELYLLEKACYELIYELNNRPDWAHIPLQAVARLAIA